MIFYFSGEGNSAWVAWQIAQQLGEEMVFIPDVDEMTTFQLKSGESLGFVFPCYGWHVPRFVKKFVTRLQVSHADYVWAVITCGDDTGLTGKLFENLIQSKGWYLASVWGLQMPETYICLPGFDVDNPAKEERKIQMARLKIARIVDAISQHKVGIRDTLSGKMAWAKTRIVGSVFQWLLMSDNSFHVNQNCIGCGRCAQVCSRHNIVMQPCGASSESASSSSKIVSFLNQHPRWLHDCTLCLSCYHHCPTHAIHWGRQTKNKGQYLCTKPPKLIHVLANQRDD